MYVYLFVVVVCVYYFFFILADALLTKGWDTKTYCWCGMPGEEDVSVKRIK
jgi:hypothetical protein